MKNYIYFPQYCQILSDPTLNPTHPVYFSYHIRLSNISFKYSVSPNTLKTRCCILLLFNMPKTQKKKFEVATFRIHVFFLFSYKNSIIESNAFIFCLTVQHRNICMQKFLVFRNKKYKTARTFELTEGIPNGFDRSILLLLLFYILFNFLRPNFYYIQVRYYSRPLYESILHSTFFLWISPNHPVFSIFNFCLE